MKHMYLNGVCKNSQDSDHMKGKAIWSHPRERVAPFKWLFGAIVKHDKLLNLCFVFTPNKVFKEFKEGENCTGSQYLQP